MFSRVFLRLENAECPILTSRFSTLEPALSGVEGVGFHSRAKLGILLEAGNRTTPGKSSNRPVQRGCAQTANGIRFSSTRAVLFGCNPLNIYQ